MSALHPRRFVPSFVTTVSLHWFTALICPTPFTDQSFSTTSTFIFLVPPSCLSTYSATRTLTPRPHRSQPALFYVCFSSTQVCTELCDVAITSIIHHTHLPDTLYDPVLFASITVHIFSRSLLCFVVFIHVHTDALATPKQTLSLLCLTFIHAGLYQAL